jgi:hypothetical protein
LLHRAIALLPAWSAVEADEDLYRSLGLPPVAYWRESPLENALDAGVAPGEP